ncbi:MAG: hypothetical protein IPP90_10695 [Gemmatimonadaceae bacterium]|nr:hypothetical protein [Gemmatimonadaceae bacterium]
MRPRTLLAVASCGVALCGCHENTAAPVVHVTAVTLQARGDSLFLGRAMRLNAAAIGDSTIGTAPRFIWTSSDTNVVVVDSLGTVLGVGVGTATVRAELQGQRAQRAVRIVLQRADGGVTFTDGSANDSRSCALASGVVYCRAAPTAADSTPLLVRMPGAAGLSFTAVEGSLHAACALNVDGRIMCWGNNGHYIFGRAGTVAADTGPVAVSTARRFSSFTHGGHAQTCGVDRTDGIVYCWGHNDGYQLGRGFLSAQDSTPAPVGGNLRGAAVSTVNFSTCLLDPVGAAFCAGSANVNRSRLGIDETGLPAEVPMPVTGGLLFKRLSAGDSGVCAISKSDDAFCWGLNSSGQLGIGSTVNPPTGPQQVLGGLKFSLIATVYRSSTCGITLEGDLYCWGQFAPIVISSRLGERALRPYHRIKGIKFKSLTKSEFAATCGVTTDGRVYCWN